MRYSRFDSESALAVCNQNESGVIQASAQRCGCVSDNRTALPQKSDPQIRVTGVFVTFSPEHGTLDTGFYPAPIASVAYIPPLSTRSERILVEGDPARSLAALKRACKTKKPKERKKVAPNFLKFYNSPNHGIRTLQQRLATPFGRSRQRNPACSLAPQLPYRLHDAAVEAGRFRIPDETIPV